MATFNWKVFWTTFCVMLPISFTILWTAAGTLSTYSLTIMVAALFLSAIMSVCPAYVFASYGLHQAIFVSTYRAVMRNLAKKAIRDSTSHARTRIVSSGIFELDGSVAIRVEGGRAQGITNGTRFEVYEGTNDGLWGRVETVNARFDDCDCLPYDRENADFWEMLEDRMKSDTSPPANVYLVREVPESEILDTIVELLDNWR